MGRLEHFQRASDGGIEPDDLFATAIGVAIVRVHAYQPDGGRWIGNIIAQAHAAVVGDQRVVLLVLAVAVPAEATVALTTLRLRPGSGRSRA